MYISSDPQPHVLVFPYPALGHMLPLLDLTHQLCLHNLTVTVLVTPQNLPFLSALLSAHPSAALSPLVLPIPSHPSLPSGHENLLRLGNSGNFPLMSALPALSSPVQQWFRSHPNPPSALISDFFLGWTHHLAAQLSVPRFAFFSSGAFVASVLDHCFNHPDRFAGRDECTFHNLPRSPTFKAEHLPSTFRRYLRLSSGGGEEPADTRAFRDGIVVNSRSYGCVFNSSEALESEHLGHFKGLSGHERVYAVGPVRLTGHDSPDRGGMGQESDATQLLAWLDTRPDGAVLYVCFGSQKTLTEQQASALALGLEGSTTQFVWVVKPGQSVPEGFEERVAGRGYVFRGWAPQVVVLKHRAVGGFLSHCGWNSVLEAIVGRVMILAWPMEADQFINATLLVEDLGVAVRVCEGAETVPDGEEIGRTISEAMGEGGDAVRAKMKEIGEEAVAAAAPPDGSSFRDLKRLVQELRNISNASRKA